jgi:hypothetical protein
MNNTHRLENDFNNLIGHYLMYIIYEYIYSNYLFNIILYANKMRKWK